MTTASPQRAAILAACIAAPLAAGAIWLSAVEVHRIVQPQSPIFGDPPSASLAAAIAEGGGVEQAFAFIRAGQDPNAPIEVADADYTRGHTISVSPLMLAVAARDENTVSMLLSFGARLDLPQNRLAGCLARALNASGIADAIARAGGAGLLTACPEPPQQLDAPLLWWR